MTQQQILDFIAEKNSPGMITEGDFKKLLVLEVLLMCKITGVPADMGTICIYTKLTEKDLSNTVKKLIMEGTITESSHHLTDDKILSMNFTEQ